MSTLPEERLLPALGLCWAWTIWGHAASQYFGLNPWNDHDALAAWCALCTAVGRPDPWSGGKERRGCALVGVQSVLDLFDVSSELSKFAVRRSLSWLSVFRTMKRQLFWSWVTST